jgi:hypothetical protein
MSERWEERAELARLLATVPTGEDRAEAEVLGRIRRRCSPGLGAIVDAVDAYERFAALTEAVFRTLCSISYAEGTRPLTPRVAASHEVVLRAARELPGLFSRAVDAMAIIDAVGAIEQDLGEFAVRRPAAELVELVLNHHDEVQSKKPPDGKRPWFEPVRDGWVVRTPYGKPLEPALADQYIHPVRVAAMCRFLADTAP